MKLTTVLLASAFLATLQLNAQAPQQQQKAPSYGTGSNPSNEPVKGYEKKDGTNVQPSHRTAPDHTQKDNYGTKGNVNPYTGKTGTKNAPK